MSANVLLRHIDNQLVWGGGEAGSSRGELAIAPGPHWRNLALDKHICQSVYFKEINFRLYLSVSENKLVAPKGESTSAEQVFSRVPGQRQKCKKRDPHWNSTQWEALLLKMKTNEEAKLWKQTQSTHFMAEEGNANLTSSGFLQILSKIIQG